MDFPDHLFIESGGKQVGHGLVIIEKQTRKCKSFLDNFSIQHFFSFFQLRY